MKPILSDALPSPFQLKKVPFSLDLPREKVEHIWSKKKSLHPQIFDGILLATTPSHLLQGECFQIDFSHYLAIEELQWKEIYALGVSGIIKSQGAYIMGRRSAGATHYPLGWEFVPAGSLDSNLFLEEDIDPFKQLQEEAIEELGVELNEGNFSHQFLGASVDQKIRSIDLVYKIDLAAPPKLQKSREHGELTLMTEEQLKAIRCNQQEAWPDSTEQIFQMLLDERN